MLCIGYGRIPLTASEMMVSVKVLNCLPPKIKQLTGNIQKFKVALRKFLLIGSFYTTEEFLDWTSASDLYTMYMQ